MGQMACTLRVAWDERLTDYHFGPGHPLAPVRMELTRQLAREFGLWNLPGVTVTAPVPAADADLELVHDARYIAAMSAGCAPSTRSSRRCWPSSGRRSWSASTAPTPTGWIRWLVCQRPLTSAHCS